MTKKSYLSFDVKADNISQSKQALDTYKMNQNNTVLCMSVATWSFILVKLDIRGVVVRTLYNCCLLSLEAVELAPPTCKFEDRILTEYIFYLQNPVVKM